MSVLDSRARLKRFSLIAAAIIIFALGAGFGMRMSNPSGRAVAQDTPDAAGPAFIQRGDKIFIPEGSMLRSRLLVQKVTMEDGPHKLLLPATVEADPARTVNILPPVAGKVVKLEVRLGDRVRKGQPLVVIASGDLAQAYADDDKARDALRLAGLTLKRVRGLNKAGAGALKDLQQAESDYTQAQAEFNRAEARLRDIGVPSRPKDGGRYLTLTAPVAGSVTALSTATGSYINDQTASLMTISNLDSVWVTANVPEDDISHIFRGQSVDVSFPAYPDKVFHGSVSFISDVVEPDTRRTKVRIAFSNRDGRLKPNMFANASFNIPQKAAVFVPDSALLMNNDSTVIFIEIAPWTFVKREVVPGYGEGDGARIDHGLNPGDRILVKGGVLLND